MVPDVAGLRAAFRTDAAFRSLLEFVAQDQPRAVTRIVRITARHQGPPRLNRAEVLRHFAHLGTLGFGTLLDPNKKTRARFAWRLRLSEILHLARTPDAQLTAAAFLPGHEPELPTLAPPPDGMSRQTVPLLPGRTASFIVPEDLSEEEAQWLGAYLQRYARERKCS